MDKKRVYRIVFHNQGKIYEVHARHVNQGNLYGFVEIRDLLFGERSAVLVDPSEERLKAEFQGVKGTYVPMHAIIRIDEVEKKGANKISSGDATGNVTPFPVPFYPPRGGPNSS
jgi:hypothetical protein